MQAKRSRLGSSKARGFSRSVEVRERGAVGEAGQLTDRGIMIKIGDQRAAIPTTRLPNTTAWRDQDPVTNQGNDGSWKGLSTQARVERQPAVNPSTLSLTVRPSARALRHAGHGGPAPIIPGTD